ncbi:hypothetical protein, partial [Silvimonas amylolytica]|uniref:hypothetical protein n=1 Tax=Silvimonas amylolytica TaxID=449663 RepID=UPI001E3B7145
TWARHPGFVKAFTRAEGANKNSTTKKEHLYDNSITPHYQKARKAKSRKETTRSHTFVISYQEMQS